MITYTRGVSTVVATVLILLITVSVAAIVAGVVVPFVRDTLIESTSCHPYKEYFTIETSEGYACFNKTLDSILYGIPVRAAPGEEGYEKNIRGFKIVFNSEGSSISVQVNESQSNARGANAIWMLGDLSPAITLPKQGEVTTFVYSSTNMNPYSSVTIHPVLKSGKICDASDSYRYLFPKRQECEEASVS